MLIFGWGRVTQKNSGPTIAINCPNCKNDVWLHLLGYRKWFTLFFIPIFPYESKHLLLCGVCSQGLELRSEQIERAKRTNELTQLFLDKQLAENEYLHEVEKIKLIG